MSSEQELEMAEQQFIGFAHAKSGLGIIELAQGMVLTAPEWKQLRDTVPLDQLDIKALDDHFKRLAVT